MNEKQKLKYIKKHMEGLNYLNKLLMDALSHHEEIYTEGYQFLYLNNIMQNKFEKILKIL